MITPEAYRAVVGRWQSRAVSSSRSRKKYRSEPCSQHGFCSPEKHVGEIYTTGIVLTTAMVLLPIVWITLTLRMMKVEHQKDETDLSTPLPLKVFKLLLVMGGVETNPGPEAENRDALQGIQCEHCGGIFSKKNMPRHKKRWHETRHLIICRFCKRPFEKKEAWAEHMELEHKPRTRRWKVSNHALQRRVLEVSLLYEDDKLESALGEGIRKEVFSQIQYYLRYYGAIRYRFNFACLMRKENMDGTIMDTFYFNNEPQNLVKGEEDLNGNMNKEFELLRNQVLSMEVDNQEGSGWIFECSEAFMISITKMSSKTMGSYINFLPRNEKGNLLKAFRKYTINVRNTDDQKCAIYCIILSKFGKEIQGDLTLPTHLKPFMDFVDDTDVEYPVSEKDLLYLERNNSRSLNIAINVWRYVSSERIDPYYISKVRTKGKTECNMLLIEEACQEGEVMKQHLIHISDVAALFRESCGSGQLKKHTFCPSCFHFKTQSYTKMMKHWRACTDSNYFKKIYPEPEDEFLPDGRILPPPNSSKSERPYLRGFFDFETMHSPQNDSCGKCLTKLKKLGFSGTFEVDCQHHDEQKTVRVTELPAICFNLLILDEEGSTVFEEYYQGTDAATQFSKLLFAIEDKMMKIIDTNTKMVMTDEDCEAFEEATECEECGKVFDETVPKCRDHHHLSGTFRGTLCNNCNLQKKNLRFIPLYCHNFSGFDSHLILRSLDIDQNRFKTLSRNTEKIITMTLGKFRLIDSSSFMPESLENLVSNLLDKGRDCFKQTEKISQNSETKFELLTRKGVFPYEYLDDVSKLDDEILPPQSAFYSALKEASVDDTEYAFAQKVWNKFECKTLGSYMKLYCTLDVRLLADVWTDWAATTSKPFKIEAEAGFISLPSFAFNCFLGKTYQDDNVEITLIDKNMIPFHDDVQQGIRGGSCLIKQKAAFDTAMETALISQANDEERAEYEIIMKKYEKKADKQSRKLERMGAPVKLCDQEGCLKRVSHKSKMCTQHAFKTILALDFTNLYGYSMTHKMPIDSFRNMDDEELTAHQSFFDSNLTQENYDEKSDEGFIFRAQLDFPKKVQRKLLSYPLVPEALLVEEDMLSKGQKSTWKALFSRNYSNGGHKKMINSFRTKKNYTSHYQLLSYLASLGVKVTLIKGYAFRQTEFISGYVNFCSAQRKKSANAADKKLWKNMANIIYGKFIGNLFLKISQCLVKVNAICALTLKVELTSLLCRRSPKKSECSLLQLV